MFNYIKNLLFKSSATGRSIFMANRQAEWSKRNYAAFADEGYRKNVICYQAIDKVAKAVASIPWVLKNQNDEEIIDGELFQLINRPNPVQSRVELIQTMVGFYKIAGNMYVERTMIGNRPKELYTLRPDRMTVKLNDDGLPGKYIYRVSNEEQVTWETEKDGSSDILHVKTFNPLDDVYGMSPIEAGAFGIDQHNEASAWLQSLLQNGAAPSGVLEMPSGSGDLTDDQYNRLKADLDEKYSGSRNAGRPLLLEGGLKWQQMGLSPQNMSIIETKYSSARDISLAIGVPPLLLNIPGDSTYNNYKEARLAFYEETVIPLAHHILEEFTAWLGPLFEGFKLELDLEETPVMIEKRSQLWEMADKSTDLTINERRQLKGYEKVDNGDIIYIDANKIPLSFDNPSDEGEPDDIDAAEKGRAAYGNINRK